MANATKPKPADDSPLVFDLNLPDTTLGNMVNRRASEATAHWNKEYNLEKARTDNRKMVNSDYLKRKLRSDDDDEIFSDNKIFTAIRTLVPFLTSNMTQPEITPANADGLSRQFAQDFEKILVEVAEDAYGRDQVKLAIQDVLSGERVGILKWVYNPNKGKLELLHVRPDSCVIGKRSKLHEEYDFFQETQERTVGDLVRQFPDKKQQIYKVFSIQKGVPSQLEEMKKITENWIFVEEEDALKLGIIWMIADTNTVLGAISDPNWNDSGQNMLDEHMMPYITFNFLNDGSGYIDSTSFVEQAQYNQRNYDRRGQTIADNAEYAGIGVPVFGAGAVKEETAAKVRFNPKTRILLDTEDVGKSFTTWNGGQLQPFVFSDKLDAKQQIFDIFGTNQIQMGSTVENPNQNLGQDVLLRNQAEGRQQELIDCVDNGMDRLYQIEAQMIYRYFDTPHYYNFIGDNGEFEHLILTQKKMADNAGIKIRIKSGTSLPVDRSQKLATALELAKMNRIGTLELYRQLGVEDPETKYKEFLTEHLLPFGDLQKADEDKYSREAEEDLQVAIGGKIPDDREDITDDYIQYLNEYMYTNKFHLLNAKQQQDVKVFVANVIAQAQRKALVMSTQQNVSSNPDMMMPPVRGKLSISSKDLQPDVLAQAVQFMGYKPSAMTPLEMQAGIMDSPTIRIQEMSNPLTDPNPAGNTQPGVPPGQQPPSQPQAPQPKPAPPAPVVNIHNHPK